MRFSHTRTTADHTIFTDPPTHYRDAIVLLWRLQENSAEAGRPSDAAIAITGTGQVIDGLGDPGALARLLAAAAQEEPRGHLVVSPSTLAYRENLSIAAAVAATEGAVRFITTEAERSLWDPPAT